MSPSTSSSPPSLFPLTSPQAHYFHNKIWKIPGTDGWTITGHSRALERTGFWIPQVRVMLDAAVDLPTSSGARPAAICITHGHIDHMSALPMLLRHMNAGVDAPVDVLAPAQIIYRLRQYAQLSWAVKVDDGEELPQDYSLPPESERYICSEDPTKSMVYADKYRNWHGVVPNGIIPLSKLGKKGSQSLHIRTVPLFHGLCSSIGYILSSPSTTQKKLKSHFIGATKQETGQNAKAAKLRGEDIHEIISTPEQPKLAFVLDTTIDALNPEKSPIGAKQILSCPVIMVECTYLEDSKATEAERRGHVWWGGLLPFVRQQFKQRKQISTEIDSEPSSKSMPTKAATTWILVHFSLRYKDQDIVDFFQSPEQSGIVLEPVTNAFLDGTGNTTKRRPADVVLWLDSGPKELWIKSFQSDDT